MGVTMEGARFRDRSQAGRHLAAALAPYAGLSTGSTMGAAAATLKAQHPDRLVVAIPVAPAETCASLRNEVDEVVCARAPDPFFAVGNWYDDFSQITDDEVRELLRTGSA